MQKTAVVSAGIIRRGRKILIARRKDDSMFENGRWEFPGGKVEFGEAPEDTLIREIKEELGITVSVDRLFAATSHIYARGDLELHLIMLAYLADYVSGNVRNIECQDSRWVDVSELGEYDFSEADKPILAKVAGTGL